MPEETRRAGCPAACPLDLRSGGVSLPAGCRRRSNRRGARRAARVRPGISDRTLVRRCASAPSEGAEPEQGCSRQEGAWSVSPPLEGANTLQTVVSFRCRNASSSL
ncbi:hypothetical protein EYF80_028859 [Liparis tanakae]|uniref:Uncharacterized protein n=1 Tax=Liparis tanakae TaxID=230148 RepID=A0A4Z2H7Q3_9TELE|nr:hypothetical protein EYF80_028859 [Liparis tanakae]